MAVASPRRPKAKRDRTNRGAPVPWWGEGLSPLERWPGVTIPIPAVWRSATDRWESPDGTFWFDRQAADNAVDFFPDLLTHHMGEFAGRPFDLLAYQKLLLSRPIFGWKRSTDGLRRFRKLFAFIPKGGGKSPWAAGTGLYLARCDSEMAAEVYALANDRNQARTVHTNAKYMVEDSPHLSDGAEILKDAIYWNDTRSTFMVLSSDASSAHGKRPHGLIFDELHGYSGDRDRELFEALKKSLIKRRQPVLAMITHAGTDDESVCFEEYEYAKALLSGTIQDETHLPVVFEALTSDDWASPEVHARVNPGYGVTVKADAIEIECLEAKNEPRKRNDFLRYHLNRWVNQATAWIPVDWWDACNAPMPSDTELRQYPCANATDMAQKIDLAANVSAFRLPLEDDEPDAAAPVEVMSETETGELVKKTYSLDYRVVLVPAFWLPDETLRERVKNDHVRYDIYRDERQLNVVDGAIIGADAIVKHLVGRDGKSGELARFPRLKGAQFAYDPAFATEVALSLRDGYGLTIVEVLQNYKHLSEACQVFEALVKAKRIIHGGHRLLRWNIENVAIKRDDAGRIRPVKPKKATKRIDGVVAAIMAISRLMLLPPERKKRHRGAMIYTQAGWVPAVPTQAEGAP